MKTQKNKKEKYEQNSIQAQRDQSPNDSNPPPSIVISLSHNFSAMADPSDPITVDCEPIEGQAECIVVLSAEDDKMMDRYSFQIRYVASSGTQSLSDSFDFLTLIFLL